MATIKQQLHLYYYDSALPGEGSFMVFTGKGPSLPFVFVRSFEVEVEIPDNFDPRSAKLASLKDEEKRIRAEFAARITELQRQQAELLALEAA